MRELIFCVIHCIEMTENTLVVKRCPKVGGRGIPIFQDGTVYRTILEIVALLFYGTAVLKRDDCEDDCDCRA